MTIRLAEHSLHTYRLPYARPVRWSDTVEDAGEFLLLRLQADSGHVGVAEMTLKPTWTGASLRSLAAILEDVFMPLLRGQPLEDIEPVRAALDGIPENHAAKALIDNALWDLHASRLGRPLWRQWQGSPTVPLSWAVTRQAPAAMAAEAEACVAEYGFETLKIKGGQGLDTDVLAMREIRRAVGDGVALYVDANGAYDARDAVAYARAMADAGAEVVEDPCRLAPDSAFQAMQATIDVPLLVDFACRSRRDAALFLHSGARALSLKPGRFGLTDTRAMACLAAASGARVVTGLFGESALGTLAALQLASTLPADALAAEVTWFLAMTSQVGEFSLPIQGGRVTLPETAGQAALVDWSRTHRLAG